MLWFGRLRAKAPDLLAVSFLLGLTVAFFAPILGGASFSTVAGHHLAVYPWRAFDPEFPDYPQSDQADLSYPWQAFLDRSLRAGSFPFWNPYSFGGQPLFANGSSAVLYPPRLVATLLPLSWAHDLLSILHVLLAGVGMWLLLRELRLGALASLLGSTAWMLSPFNAAWLHLEVVAPAAAWLPLSLWLTHRAIDRRSWRAAAAASAALACTLVSGHLLFMALVYGIVVAYAAALALNQVWRHRQEGIRDPLLRVALVAVGPLTLAAVVLLPTVLFLHSLGRQPLSYDIVHAGARVPYGVFLHLLRPPTVPPVTALQMHELAYVGRIVAILAVVGFFARQPSAWLGRGLTIGTFLVATDTLGLRWIYAVLPQFSFFTPLGRLLNLFAFGVILLGAGGLDVIVRWATRHRSSPAQVLPGGGASAPAWRGPIGRRALEAGGVVVGVAIILATCLELIGFARRVNPPFPPREARYSYPQTPLIRALARELSAGHNGPGLVLPVRASLTHGWMPPILYAAESMVFGFESTGGYDSTLPTRTETVWRIVAGEPMEAVLAARYRRAYNASFEVQGTRLDLLPRLGVTTIVAAPEVGDDPEWQRRRVASLDLRPVYTGIDGRIYRIVGSSGGPQVVSRMEIVESGEGALRRALASTFDYRTQAVFEWDDLPPQLRSHGGSPVSGSARVLSKGVNGEEIAVRVDGAAWLVIPTNWDPGWRAWVDGREVPVVRANYALQAVPVTAGASRVRLSYRPPGFAVGLVLSLGSLVGLSILFARSPRPSRWSGPRA